jgi:hypothetical protein
MTRLPLPSGSRSARGFRPSGALGAGLRAATAAALVVDAVVHLRDAGFYDSVVGSVVSQGALFRAEAGAALLVAVLLLAWPARWVWAAALLVAGSAAAAVLLYTAVDVGALGPLPDMYEPTWALPGKPLSAVAEVAGALLAAAGLVLTWPLPRRRFTSRIDIDADPEQVWAVLGDLAAYREWNPFIVEAEGEARTGTRLVLRMRTGTGRPVTLRPTVLEAQEGRRLRWLGRPGVPGLLDGDHSFTLTELPGGGTRLVQEETFRGVLVPLLSRTLDHDMAPAFHAMEQALKRRVEFRAAARRG